MDKLAQTIAAGKRVPFAEIVAAWARFVPLLAVLKNTRQDPVWHAEGDVAIHTERVCDEVQKIVAATPELTPEERLSLQIGAIFHDVGKPLVTRPKVFDDREHLVAPHHAERGRDHLALRIPLLGLSPTVEDNVLALTGFHHDPRRLVQADAPAGRWRRLARLCPVRLVYHLEQADLRGRTCPDLDAQLEILELFRLRCEELELWNSRDPWAEWRQAIEDAFISQSPSFRCLAMDKAIRDAEAGVIQSVEEGIARAWSIPKNPVQLSLLCGPSGAGKSEWIRKHAGSAEVLSLDALREEIAGKRADQSMNGQVLQAAKERLKDALRNGRSVVWDATNLRRDGRHWVTQLGYDYGAHVTLVALQTPVPILLTRNRRREHPVPAEVLHRQIESFEWPTADEAHRHHAVRLGSPADHCFEPPTCGARP